MTFNQTTAVSVAPALRDAFAPDDAPAELRYSAEAGTSLSLTDAGGFVGDPVREFVADVLKRIDDNTDALELKAAEARIQPGHQGGHGVDLAALNRRCFEMRAVGAFFTPLMLREMCIDIPIYWSTSANGDEQVESVPQVRLADHGETPTAELTRAMNGYIRAVSHLTTKAIKDPLGAWIVDSGVTKLHLSGRFTVPMAVTRNSAGHKAVRPSGDGAPFMSRAFGRGEPTRH